MDVSVDISLYPLQDEYIPMIKDLIERVQQREGIDVSTNALSTQLFGEYRTVMSAVTEELEYSFQTWGKAVLVAKIVNGDARRLSGDGSA